VRRRDFITLFLGATVCPLAASAQTPPKIPRVSYVFGSTPTRYKHNMEAFRQGLRELGYVEGQTIVLELRWAEGRSERMSELMAELVGLFPSSCRLSSLRLVAVGGRMTPVCCPTGGGSVQ
jgi:putative tryptophan/tyrosine transport system substrate-binding protein